jgi:nucleoside phosphorylase
MDVNFAIVLTALQVEFLSVRAHLVDPRPVAHPEGTAYDIGAFASTGAAWNVAVAQTGSGNVRAAIEAERAISHFHPSHLLFVGVAGGLKDVAIGDVVAATKVYGYESGKAQQEFLTRTEIGESSYDLVQQAMRVAREGHWQQRISPMPVCPPNAIVAPIAAGEKVVASKNAAVFQILKRSFSDAAAVEMEGFGALRAGYANAAVSSLVVRGISDLIEKKTEADAGGSQRIASAHAAAFAFEVLSKVKSLADPPISSGARLASEVEATWTRLEGIAAELYPKGPTDAEVWSRAGGDLSVLDLNLSGRAGWHAALRKLRQGGGGRAVSLNSLLSAMRSDFPNHTALRAIEEFFQPQ